MCFLRDSSVDSAIECLHQVEPLRHLYPKLVAVGLDSDEIGHPPSKFTEVFKMARAKGFHAVGHGGHDGPAHPYVSELITCLNVNRIDHGVTCIEDPSLVEKIRELKISFTVCPISNVKIGPFPSLSEHPVKRMIDAGLIVTLNSDDPAYLQSYISEVFYQVAVTFRLSELQLASLSKNAVHASFMEDFEKANVLSRIDDSIKKSVH